MDGRRLDEITRLFHHRWCVPILAELQRGSGAKFITLVNRLGISRDSLRRTLDALIAWRLVQRNPGHGHPLRPEYVLTRQGARVAPWCVQIMAALKRLGLEDDGLRKWFLPVAIALRAGHARFADLKESLPGITARALTLALKSLQQARLVRRRVQDGYPPTTSYELTPRSKPLWPVLGM